MALNDEDGRLNTAEDYLLQYAAASQEFEAALEHVLWVHKQKPEYRKRCEDILWNVIQQRAEEKSVLAAIGAIK